MYESARDVWAKGFRERRLDVSTATIEQYLHNHYRVEPDFVYSVSRDFAKSLPIPSAQSAHIPGAFSKARTRAIYRFSKSRKCNWSST
jgi:hypothetical protein